MPSLRRTVSESASTVRSSPYPTALSLSAAGALNEGSPVRPRRTCSDTSSRRVLADIEWWRILDGQQEDENDPGNENENENGQDRVTELQPGLIETAQESTSVTPLSAAALMRLDEEDASAAAVVASPDVSQGASSLTTPFAALSISSITPPMTPPRSRNASYASSSSAESSPDSSPRTPALQRETLFMDEFPPFKCTSLDDEFYTPFLPFLDTRAPSATHGLPMIRSVSFAGFDAPRESAAEDERFGDVIFI